MKRWQKILLAPFGLYLACSFGWNQWQQAWYRGMIPAAIEIGETVAIDGESGMREGCGAAVFRLTPAMQSRLRAQGSAALANAHQARNQPNKHYFTFKEWRSTPYTRPAQGAPENDNWLGGIGCAKLDEQLQQQIGKALATSGAFYAASSESGLIVIPELGLLVLSYEG